MSIEDKEKMDMEFKLILMVILPILLILSGFYALGSFTRDRTMTSSYEYEVVIETDGEIEEISVRVPFPADQLEGDFSHPEGWNTTVDEEENMLLINAFNISTDSNNTLSLTVKSGEEIRTRDPFEEEPMLYPEANFEEGEAPNESQADRYYTYDDTSLDNTNRTIEVLDFNADLGTEVEIQVELLGKNGWWLLDEIEEKYRDRLSADVEGEGSWAFNGEVETGLEE